MCGGGVIVVGIHERILVRSLFHAYTRSFLLVASLLYKLSVIDASARMHMCCVVIIARRETQREHTRPHTHTSQLSRRQCHLQNPRFAHWPLFVVVVTATRHMAAAAAATHAHNSTQIVV